MRIERVRLGRVREYQRPDGVWTSAIGKEPVDSAVWADGLGLRGDQQADRVNHGGVDKAILCYCRAHYAAWRAEYGERAPAEGSLGENLEITGLDEDSVCVGDRFECGEGGAVLEVSQPRQPCWKPALLHGLPDLTARILRTGRTGWYVRVWRTGEVSAPVAVRLKERPHPEWTIARATEVMHFSKDPVMWRALAELPELSLAWREELRAKIASSSR